MSPCPFFKNGLCSIYPVRPEGCKLFPFTFDFKDYGIGCEGLKRLRQVEEIITEDCSEIISRSKSVEVEKIYAIAIKAFPILINKFLETNPSKEEKETFFKMNSLPEK